METDNNNEPKYKRRVGRPRKGGAAVEFDPKRPLYGMPDELHALVDQMSPMQRRYAEYRARGLSQTDAAIKAGSKGQTREILGRVGYNMEYEIKGLKDYIAFLQKKTAEAAMLTSTEIIEKLREVYEQAMKDGKYSDANKALELMGNAIQLFKQQGKGSSTPIQDEVESRTTKNNVGAFKEEGSSTINETKRKLASLLKDQK